MNLSKVCKPRQSVFERSRSDVVVKIDDLLKDRSNQASTFLLSQAMGGGKTHNMIALGLLAKNPALRQRFWAKMD